MIKGSIAAYGALGARFGTSYLQSSVVHAMEADTKHVSSLCEVIQGSWGINILLVNWTCLAPEKKLVVWKFHEGVDRCIERLRADVTEPCS